MATQLQLINIIITIIVIIIDAGWNPHPMCKAAIDLVLAKDERLMNTENWWNDNWQGQIEIQKLHSG